MTAVGATLEITSTAARWPCHLRNIGAQYDVTAAAAAAAAVDESDLAAPCSNNTSQ